MALILTIETATNLCAAALSENGQVIISRESDEDKSHARLLAGFVDELLNDYPQAREKLQAVAVSEGPGSYTGLRIGVSTAKGLAYALNIPLLAISTLQAMAWHAAKEKEHEGLYVPMIDARRMEVYTATYNRANECLQNTRALILDEESFRDTLDQQPHIFLGNGAEKASQVIQHPHAQFVPHAQPSVHGMAHLAEKDFQNKAFKDVAYFEPFYLKNFIPTTPKKNILG